MYHVLVERVVGALFVEGHDDKDAYVNAFNHPDYPTGANPDEPDRLEVGDWDDGQYRVLVYRSVGEFDVEAADEDAASEKALNDSRYPGGANPDFFDRLLINEQEDDPAPLSTTPLG